jgi:hypothetical protein
VPFKDCQLLAGKFQFLHVGGINALPYFVPRVFNVAMALKCPNRNETLSLASDKSCGFVFSEGASTTRIVCLNTCGCDEARCTLRKTSGEGFRLGYALTMHLEGLVPRGAATASKASVEFNGERFAGWYMSKPIAGDLTFVLFTVTLRDKSSLERKLTAGMVILGASAKPPLR